MTIIGVDAQGHCWHEIASEKFCCRCAVQELDGTDLHRPPEAK